MTDFNHTGTLEIYHSLYNKSCPVMIARTQLAAIDFNSGVGLVHRKNKEGDL